MKVCIDTNIFISIINKEADAIACKKILRAIEKQEITGCVSTIAIAEMLVGFYQNDEDQEADTFIAKVQKNCEILPVTLEIAQNAALIRAKNKIKLPDALVLASAKSVVADFLLSKDHPFGKKDSIIIKPQDFADKYLSNLSPDLEK